MYFPDDLLNAHDIDRVAYCGVSLGGAALQAHLAPVL